METVKEFLEQYTIDFTQALDPEGRSTVYLAVNADTGEQLAVKSVEMHPMFDKGMLEAQVKAAMQLSHPNLLKYQAVYRFENKQAVHNYLLMPLMGQKNLASIASSLTLQQKNEVIEAVLEGLKYLHGQGQCWQQLRADHILLQSVQDIYIPLFINYGATEPLPLAQFINYEYLAPEQLLEQTEKVGPQTDIWAFGVLLFELFAGYLPFGKKSPQSPNRRIQDRITKEEMPEIPQQIPATYRTIIEGCLQREVGDRWASVAEIQDYIENNPAKMRTKAREVGILETLERMGEDSEEEVDAKPQGRPPLLQRSFKRKPARPVRWWEPILWLGIATLIGYLLSTYL